MRRIVCELCGLAAECKCVFTPESLEAGKPVCKRCAKTAVAEEMSEITGIEKDNMAINAQNAINATVAAEKAAKDNARLTWRRDDNWELPDDAPELLVDAPMLIPRIFHWVWVGDAEIGERDRDWISSWISTHKAESSHTWRFILWSEKGPQVFPGSVPDGLEIRPFPPLVNQKWYNGIEKWVTGRAVLASRSDIVRMEVIARYGGIYIDTDVECFQSVDSILRGVRAFYADEWGPTQGNFMFGAVPNFPALWTCVRELGPKLNEARGALNATDATGPQYLGPRMRTHPDTVIFPHMLFNPLCAFDDPNQVEVWPDCSYANHHYDGKWYDRTKKAPPAEFLRRGS